MEEKSEKKQQHFLFESSKQWRIVWWVEDEKAQNDIIYLLFLDADEMKRTE